MIRPRDALSTLALALASACGGDTEPPKSAVEAEHVVLDEEGASRPIQATAEIGGLNEDAVTTVFQDTLPALQKCLNEGAERIEFIGGEIAFFVKVGSDGRVVHAHAERTTLGDRETERCMLRALSRQSWPRPVGGDVGLARNSYDFDMANDVRAPVDWDPEQVSDVLSDLSDELAGCKDGSRGEFTATVYVNDDGTALGAGVAPSDESGESAADCIAEALSSATYPSPGSWPAKVTFSF